MPVRLTEKSVTKAVADSAAGKTYDVTDVGAAGLILRAAPRGAVWIWRYMWDGRYRRQKIGTVSLINLTIARSVAATAREYLVSQDRPVDDAWVREQLMRRRVIPTPPIDVIAPPPRPPKPVTWTYS